MTEQRALLTLGVALAVMSGTLLAAVTGVRLPKLLIGAELLALVG